MSNQLNLQNTFAIKTAQTDSISTFNYNTQEIELNF